MELGKSFRRLCFKLAFRGCKAECPEVDAYVEQTIRRKSRESEVRIERALALDFYARKLGS